VPWTAVRSGPGALQVPWTAVRSGAGALQVPWTAVRSGAEIGLLGLRLSVSQGAPIGDFLLASACPMEKVTLWRTSFIDARCSLEGGSQCGIPI